MIYDWEPQAMRNERVPPGLDTYNRLLYVQVRALYGRYHAKQIDRVEASAEKKRIEYETAQLMSGWEFDQKLIHKTTGLWKEIEQHTTAYRKHDRADLAGLVEIADAILKTIYGVGVKT